MMIQSVQTPGKFFNNVLKTGEDEIASLPKWMQYRGYENFIDLCVDFHLELNNIHDFSDYRVDGLKCPMKFGTMNKLRLFISLRSTRMKDTTVELYAEHLLDLTYEQCNVFRKEDMKRMSSEPISPPPGPNTLMTSLTGHTKRSATFESQITLNNFKLYYDTFQISFLATIKAQELSDVADPDFGPDDGDQCDKQLFNERTLLCSVKVILFRQTREENWPKSLRGMQEPSFPNFIITILSPRLHNVRL